MTPPALAQPLPLPCGVTLPNRLGKAAMSEQLADRHNHVSHELLRLYDTWGSAGCGLLVTGNMMVSRDAISEPRQVVIDSDTDRDALRSLAANARRGGSQVWVQLNHGGRQVPRLLARTPTAPSAVRVQPPALFGEPRPLTSAEITAIVRQFASAAEIAVECGFDGVQIHAAHGYLANQFLSPLTNQRTDEWGGDPERRMRFLLDVVRAARSAVGAHVAVGVKLNSADFQRGGFEEDESLQVIQALDSERVDLLEISGGTFEAGAMVGAQLPDRTRDREAYFHHFAERARQQTTVPLMLTGGFRTAAAMDDAVAAGIVDLVGLARPLALDPSFAASILDGTDTGTALAPRRVRAKRLDALSEIAWYTHQIRRLATGRHPRPRLGALAALLVHMARTVQQATGRRFR